MPKENFKSITISSVVYDRFQELYEKKKEELKFQGIMSFSGFVTYKLNKILEDENNE